jgi:ubiquinone/menaquinone biosynthesis C-methylase UbiE
MKAYNELAEWWPLFSPPIHYVEEAAHLITMLEPAPVKLTLLELGSGGGSLAFHFSAHFDLTLTDISAGMLAQNRLVNPHATLWTWAARSTGCWCMTR